MNQTVMQPGPTPPPPAYSPKELIEMYRQLRDKKAELAAKHKAELAPVTDLMKQVEAHLLYQLSVGQMQSVNTESGTAFKVTRNSITVEDPSTFRDWANATGNTSLFENRVSKEAVEAYIAQGNTMPPGLKISSDVTVNVRK